MSRGALPQRAQVLGAGSGSHDELDSDIRKMLEPKWLEPKWIRSVDGDDDDETRFAEAPVLIQMQGKTEK